MARYMWREILGSGWREETNEFQREKRVGLSTVVRMSEGFLGLWGIGW